MTATTVRVKPVTLGSNLRHPAGGRPLSDDGDVWPNDGWTQRRIAEGGVVVVEGDEAAPHADPAPLALDVPEMPAEPAGEIQAERIAVTARTVKP